MGNPNVRVIGADLKAFTNTAGVPAQKNLLQVTTKAAKLFFATIYNFGPDQWIQLHDSAAAPAAATPPLDLIFVPANTQGYFDFPNGRVFANGIFLGNSTAAATYVAGAANCQIVADYSCPWATQQP